MASINKWAVQYSILNELFAVAEDKLKKFLRKTVTNNAEHQKLNPFGFYVCIHAGKEYYSKAHKYDVMPRWEYIEISDPFIEKFEMLHNMFIDIKRERIIISAYIITILNNSQSSADLDLLLPADVTKFYDSIPGLFPGTLAKEHFDVLTSSGKKKEHENLIKQRILTNLLIRDIYV